VYALRLFIRSMHNRVGPRVRSRDISVRDGLVLVPIVAVIVFMALYPQLALHRSERSVKAAVASAQAETRQRTVALTPVHATAPTCRKLSPYEESCSATAKAN
jgi:NADH-quinone oxidoreductase subunit M